MLSLCAWVMLETDRGPFPKEDTSDLLISLMDKRHLWSMFFEALSFPPSFLALLADSGPVPQPPKRGGVKRRSWAVPWARIMKALKDGPGRGTRPVPKGRKDIGFDSVVCNKENMQCAALRAHPASASPSPFQKG